MRSARETDKVGDCLQSFSLQVIKQFNLEGSNSQQPVKAVASQPELQHKDQFARVTDEVSDSWRYFPLDVVEQSDWDGGNSLQPVKLVTESVTDESECQQVDQSGRENDKVSDSRQYFALHVVKQFDRKEGNIQQPVNALANQSE